MSPYADLTEEQIATRLLEISQKLRPNGSIHASSFPKELLRGEPRPAAVLVPLLCDRGNWHLLFTRRTDHLVEHSGQVAFPGGRADPGDNSPEETALREANEETGILPQSVRILGRLPSFITVTNYLITPVVGSITWPFDLVLEEVEVSRAFTIPLEWLANPENHEIQMRILPAPYQPVPVIYFREYDNELLWGVSARITLNFIEILFGGSESDHAA